MSNKRILFDESDQETELNELEFRTNKSYAKHYEEFRKKEILGQLKNLKEEIGSSDSSDDETTDEEIVDPDFDKEFFRTLAFLKRKDKNKYTEKQTFFENVKPIEEVALAKRHHKEKPMTVKDYERKVMLEKGGMFEDEDDERPQPRSDSPTIVEEEMKIKDEIKQALNKLGDEESDDEELQQGKGGGLLKHRKKTVAETEKEQSDYIQWLADKKAKEPPSEEVKVLEPLKHFWSNEKLSKEDAFLKDYILNKRFVQNSGEVPTYDDIVATSEDEEQLDKQEEYERKYNFRFEEPDSDFIKQFPRVVEDSVRVERNKRKETRQALKERKQKEKEQQRQELEELKAIKLKEIREKIQRLKEIAATEKLAMNEEDLVSEFDPEEHDRRMKDMFNDEYYGIDEGDQKPEFPDLDEELGVENYDVERLDDDYAEEGPHCEDDDFVMDCEYEEKMQSGKSAKESLQQELLESTSKSKKKGRRQSKFREVLKAEKPLFDPEDEKTYGEYIDEYYKLDYEDKIGDVPCRFRYVETVPNDFGLTIEEILTANTRDLNKWASVKKAVQFRPKHVELNEIEMYRRKAANEFMKRKILPSLYAEDEDDEQMDEEIQNRKKKVAEKNGNGVMIKKEKNVAIKVEKDNAWTGNHSDCETNAANGSPLKKTKIKKEKLSANEDDNKHTPKAESVSNAEDKGTSIETETKEENSLRPKKKTKKIKETRGTIAPEEATSSSNTKEMKSKPNLEKKLDNSNNKTKFQNNRNQKQKQKWDQSGEGTHNSKQNGHWNGSKKARFDHVGSSGDRKGRGNGAGGSRPKQVENAADQRLRAFGINPTKFRNKQVYSKSASKISLNAEPANKRIKFE
ncbi:protein KRI1 homolog [Anopheles moucheti]|uniref:protein KRI1 homolog n=1 Tax=Anopheles moucheti TaxID=186751 RepID=UPI0022F09D51|nr:protein KRI1 homolog [Anopheles moucheti]XP_052894952.1 protein KRI1 homolog [Anopheles moucheti]